MLLNKIKMIFNDDLLHFIFNYLNYSQLNKTILINKQINKISNELLSKYINSIIKIQRFYKKKIINWNEIEDCSICEDKLTLIRYYLKYYEKQYFINYPEFITNKLNRPVLRQYIFNNNITKKSDVVKFLCLDNITISDIFYAGW
jgi:hypothetical protein